MHKDLLSVVVINHNGVNFLEKLLDSLSIQDYPYLEIIIIDSGSTDASYEILKKNSGSHLFSLPNKGYAHAVNYGVSKAKGDYLLIMNADVWFEKSFISDLFQEKQKRKLDVIGPRERTYDGKENNSWTICTLDPIGYPVFLYGNEGKNSQLFYLSGLCFLVEKKLYEQTRGLDDNFFMYFEETDWFWRLNLFNYNFAYSDTVKINHATPTLPTINIRYNAFLWRNQNTLQMLLKNYAWYSLLWVLPLYMLTNIFEIIFFLILGKPIIAWTYILGPLHAIKNYKSIIKQRQWIQKKRIGEDGDIIRTKMYFGLGKLRHLKLFLKQVTYAQ